MILWGVTVVSAVAIFYVYVYEPAICGAADLITARN